MRRPVIGMTARIAAGPGVSPVSDNGRARGVRGRISGRRDSDLGDGGRRVQLGGDGG
jgi:hypothetical protein